MAKAGHVIGVIKPWVYFFRRGLIVGLVAALLAWTFSMHDLIQGLENWTLDWCFQQRGARNSTAPVVLVDIDDRTVEQLRKPLFLYSPEIAAAIRYVKSQGAVAIGLDFREIMGLEGRPEIQAGQEGDAVTVGLACMEAGNVVLPETELDGGRWRSPLKVWKAQYYKEGREESLPFGNLTDDPDHFLRNQQLVRKKGSGWLNHFSLELFRIATGKAVHWDGKSLKIDGENVPLNRQGELAVNFVGPRLSFPVVSLLDVLDASAGKAKLSVNLKGAIVIFGFVTSQNQDTHASPFGNNYLHWLASASDGLMSGCEFHGHVIATLWDRAYIRHSGWLPFALSLLTGMVLGVLFGQLSLEIGAIVAVAHHLLWKFLVVGGFVAFGIRLPMVAPLIIGVLTFSLTFALRWRLLRSMMGVTQSEEIARLLEEDPTLEPKGQEIIITVLIADIRNFTDFSEKHTPVQVVSLLNAYFSAVVPCIEAGGGTVNKYLGDGILAWFGWPEAYPDHPLRAVRAAVAMIKEVHARQAEWERLGRPGLRIGIGIHTGPVIVGTIGRKKRLEYTAIGDTINAASRIESENKALQSEILISEATYASLSNVEREALACDPTACSVKVKGKEEPLLLHRVNVP